MHDGQQIPIRRQIVAHVADVDADRLAVDPSAKHPGLHPAHVGHAVGLVAVVRAADPDRDEGPVTHGLVRRRTLVGATRRRVRRGVAVDLEPVDDRTGAGRRGAQAIARVRDAAAPDEVHGLRHTRRGGGELKAGPRIGVPLLLSGAAIGAFPYVVESEYFSYIIGVSLALAAGLGIWYLYDRVSDKVHESDEHPKA